MFSFVKHLGSLQGEALATTLRLWNKSHWGYFTRCSTYPLSHIPLTPQASRTLSYPVINDQWERVLVQQPCNPATTPRCFGIVEVSLP